MTVDERVGQEVGTLLGIEDVHGTEMFVFGTDADYFLSYLDGVAVFGVESGDESICLTCFDHHHAEVVAFEHFIVSFLVGRTFACTLFRQDAGITFTARSFIGVTQVDNFNTF